MNTPTPGHALTDTQQVYRPDAEPYTGPRDSRTVVGNGDAVEVHEVFENWNGVDGLTVAYVFVPATGYHTHLSTAEMGLALRSAPKDLFKCWQQ